VQQIFFAALAVLFGLSWIYELHGLLRGSCGRIGFPSHSAPTALTFVLCLFPTVPDFLFPAALRSQFFSSFMLSW
jgi:hypothetical protein